MLGALHDTRCELEQNIGDPKTTDENYGDIAVELDKINSLDHKLKVYLNVEDP